MKNAATAAEPEFTGGTAYRYVETSALIAARVEGDAEAVVSLRGEGERVVSAITLAETGRRFIRAGIAGQFNEAQVRAAFLWLRRFERRCHTLAVTPEILARVRRRFPVEPVRTLDAIHLASIEALGEDPSLVTVVTRDKRVAENARAMGYLVE